MKLTKKQIIETSKVKLRYKKVNRFLHCDHCLTKYLKARRTAPGGNSPESPRDTFHYEMSSYPFQYPNKVNANIVVAWCKTCGRQIWDSRHLTALY